jgi:hypothetical protein
MPDGFTVDVEALKNAGLGLSDLLGDLDELQVENLTKDGQRLSRRLVDAASAYIKADQAHEHKLKGIFDDTGAETDDPEGPRTRRGEEIRASTVHPTVHSDTMVRIDEDLEKQKTISALRSGQDIDGICFQRSTSEDTYPYCNRRNFLDNGRPNIHEVFKLAV